DRVAAVAGADVEWRAGGGADDDDPVVARPGLEGHRLEGGRGDDACRAGAGLVGRALHEAGADVRLAAERVGKIGEDQRVRAALAVGGDGRGEVAPQRTADGR